MQSPLTFGTPIKDPLDVASVLALGLTAAFALSATLLPQCKETYFLLFLQVMAAFVLFSICHLVRLKFFSAKASRRLPPGAGPGFPLAGALKPVPVHPRPPKLSAAEAQAIPRAAAESTPPKLSFIRKS